MALLFDSQCGQFRSLTSLSNLLQFYQYSDAISVSSDGLGHFLHSKGGTVLLQCNAVSHSQSVQAPPLSTVLYSSTNTVTLFQSVLMVRSLFPLVKATQFYCSATLFHTQCRRHRSTRCTEFCQYSDAISVDH